ncbi:MAG: response regulator [Magnetococcales bacterium]|nr:response regulator [Magnetococcales bacterium]
MGQLDAQAKSLAYAISQAAIGPILYDDHPALQTLSESFIEKSMSISFIRIELQDDEKTMVVVEEYKPSFDGSSKTYQEIIEVDQRFPLGRVTIGMLTDPIEEQISERIAGLIMILSLMILVKVITQYFVLSGMVRRPLKKLSDCSIQIGQGDLESSISLPGKDELATLAITLDKMRMDLKYSQGKVKEHNEVSKNKLQKLVDEKTADLQIARKEADRANRAKTEFLATMSHEIRTPMNSVWGAIELLRRQKMPDAQARLVDTVSYSTKILLQIVNDILDLSKIEDGKLSLKYKVFNLEELLEHLKSSVAPSIEKKKLGFTLTIEKDIPTLLYGDSLRLRQVLWNLLSNAIKFTEQGNIAIDVQKIGSQENLVTLEFLVKDTGIGIQVEELQSIFTPFTQIDSSVSRLHQGTGLGLTICKQFIDLMGGTIRVESKYGEGVVFCVVLSFEIKSVVPEQQNKKQSGKILPLSILLVEDELVSQTVVQGLLSNEGYKVDVASDGLEALEKVGKRRFDVILMDLRMPKMDGFETTRQIRALEVGKGKSLKIVAFTADVMKDTVQQCLQAGMDEVIAKPINMEEVNRSLSSL